MVDKHVRMLRVVSLSIAILLTVAGCQDAMAPSAVNSAASLVTVTPVAGDLNILRQSPSAPRLETYHVSFWAYRDRATGVSVNYEPIAGEAVGRPFLRFDIPRGALGRRERRQQPTDSLLITLTIDTSSFAVAFEPTGIVFARRHPATLSIWYGNADPDVNGDGVVDDADQALTAQLSFWSREAGPAPWLKMASTLPGESWLVVAVPHFSDYAVSW